MARAMLVPIADQHEYRPPTQSQKGNMFSTSIPKAPTAAALVESAAKWRATAAGSFILESSHSLAVRALLIVSCVVNVFDATRNSVLSASTLRSTYIRLQMIKPKQDSDARP